jgi:hypothetical protein
MKTKVKYFYDDQGDWTLYRVSTGVGLLVEFRTAGGWQQSNFPAAMVRCFRAASKSDIRKIKAEEQRNRK